MLEVAGLIQRGFSEQFRGSPRSLSVEWQDLLTGQPRYLRETTEFAPGGKRLESWFYSEDGVIDHHFVFEYPDPLVELMVSLDIDGEPSSGLICEHAYREGAETRRFSKPDGTILSETQVTGQENPEIVSVDEQGNWFERIYFGSEFPTGLLKPIAIAFRKLTYLPLQLN